MRVPFALAIMLLTYCCGVSANDNQVASDSQWSKEQLEIIELTRFVALAPKQVGYEEYAKLFHPDFTNWYMAGDQQSLRSREQYLALVKDWLDEGNYAIFCHVEPISIEVFGDIAYVRQIKEEHFYHPDKAPTNLPLDLGNEYQKRFGKTSTYHGVFSLSLRSVQ